MKKIVFLFILLLIVLKVSAQYTLQISGSTFNIEVNDIDMTATISDYGYSVDDTKFPLEGKKRKFKYINREKVRTVTIPETFRAANGKEYTITTIGRAAFAGYRNVDHVIIPSTVTTIENYAFFRTSVVSVDIPASVKSMGDRVFGWCTKLKSLRLPEGIRMGQNIYAESKNVSVKYYVGNDQPDIVQNRPAAKKPSAQIPKQQVFANSSDVDENLPTTTKQNDEMFAIIIANENYLNVARVDCALNDGRTFQRYCQQVLGIPEDNIHIVEDATYGQMMEQVNWLSRVAKAYEGDAKIVIYYAGHGIPNEKDGSAFLLPVDVSGDNTAAAYSLNKLYAELGALNAKSVTLFMDACFSGSRRGEGMLTAARGVAIASKQESPLGNMVVFTAAQGNETAYPYAEKGHGLFTYFLLKKLKETKGNVDYGTLGEYIRKEVARKSVVVNSKPQTPSVLYAPQMSKTWKSMTLK